MEKNRLVEESQSTMEQVSNEREIEREREGENKSAIFMFASQFG